jgi:hypothetical protein
MYARWSYPCILYSTRWQQITRQEFDKNENNQYPGIRRIYVAWFEWVRQKINGEKIFCSSGFDVEFVSTPDQGGNRVHIDRCIATNEHFICHNNPLNCCLRPKHRNLEFVFLCQKFGDIPVLLEQETRWNFLAPRPRGQCLPVFPKA